ncbi:MAG: tRNA guanosine(34) transglycosylase Tgt [Candidatus Delongbacteria bacterium]|nr:tRNA guanosine(34) transglycosylase Tgt [Candidatus Delongbacteria bacterium]
MKPYFEILHSDPGCQARTGIITTAHGIIHTPVFMPVGTQGTVKALTPKDLIDNEVEIILNNTYHMYLRPGNQLIRDFGGLHHFISWNKPILTDSGGYQVFSLLDLIKISEEGVQFKSHIDGSSHFFSPERVMEIQTDFGSDIMMAFDECTPYPATYEYADQSQRRTSRWAQRCKRHFDMLQQERSYTPQLLFGIVQGSTYGELRRISAESICELDFPGNAIGGLSVGEPKSLMVEMLEITTPLLPIDKPRYLMGVGMPEDIIEAVRNGVDMFDCVVPTRYGRNGTVFTFQGKKNIRNAQFKQSRSPIDPQCQCYTCTHFSTAYLRHLIQAGEILGAHLLTLHNIHFFMSFMAQLRQSIHENRFSNWSNQFLSSYTVWRS